VYTLQKIGVTNTYIVKLSPMCSHSHRIAHTSRTWETAHRPSSFPVNFFF